MPSTSQSVTINASAADVWRRFSDFHDLSWAKKVITNVEKVGDLGGNQVGAKRILNGVFHETLIEMDNDKRVMRYSIDDGPSPVSPKEVKNYIGTVRLSNVKDGHGILVEWTSKWDSKSKDAVDFCHGIYVAMLKELEKSFKKK